MEVGKLGSPGCIKPELGARVGVRGDKASPYGLLVEVAYVLKPGGLHRCRVKNDDQRDGLGGIEGARPEESILSKFGVHRYISDSCVCTGAAGRSCSPAAILAGSRARARGRSGLGTAT